MKEWLDLSSQAQRHVQRGLILTENQLDEFKAFLFSTNYYRFSGYSRCFYDPSISPERYRAGTTFSEIRKVYEQDQYIRQAVMEGVGIVEPVMRARFAYFYSQQIGSTGDYLMPNRYLPREMTGLEVERLNEGERRSREKQLANRQIVLENFTKAVGRPDIFIKHHVSKGDPVPFWAVVEVMSIGDFSRLIRALADRQPVTKVAMTFGFAEAKHFAQAVQNIAFIRNIAAHHSRIWNLRLSGHVTLPKAALNLSERYVSTRTPVAALLLLASLVDGVEKDDSYSRNLLELVNGFDEYTEGLYCPVG